MVDWLSGWGFRKKKTVNGTSAGAQTNYQMMLKLYKGSGTDTATDVYLNNHVKDDFSDIRFTTSDGSTLLDYWIESSTSGVSAIIWIEISSIPASPNTTTIYIYYSSPSSASLSNGTNTFIQYNGQTSSNFKLSNIAYQNIRVRTKFERSATNDHSVGVTNAAAQPAGDAAYPTINVTTNRNEYTTMNNNIYSQSYSALDAANTPITFEILLSTTDVKHYREGTLMATHLNNRPNENMGLIYYKPVAGGICYWAFMSLFITPEPTFGATGSEETPSFEAHVIGFMKRGVFSRIDVDAHVIGFKKKRLFA